MSDTLDRVIKLAEQLVEAQANVWRLDEELEIATRLRNQLETEDLPELMREIGMTSVSLANGKTVEVTEEITCGISEQNRAAALKWLDDHNYGGLIKTLLNVSFNRQDRTHAVALLQQLAIAAADAGVEVDSEVKETVHAATLKSFVKEELAKGTPLPFDLFSIHPYNKARIKGARAK